ncbi:MAG TPA: cytochrome c [Geobacteraceae bacterium]|nr:cytochrome c [Geobacteraceae bacterium]
MADDNKDFDGIKYRVETKSPGVFRALFTVLIVWAVCFMAYYLFGGWSSQEEFARKKQSKQESLTTQPQGGEAPAAGAHPEGKKEDYLALGKKLYAERCVACHGADAKGGIGPDLTRKEFKYGKSEKAIAETIAEGRPGGMPAFKSDLSHEKIEGLVKYILAL